jgi:hypothetical protein
LVGEVAISTRRTHNFNYGRSKLVDRILINIDLPKSSNMASENPYSLITYPNPPLAASEYRGQESFFGGEPPLSEGIGYLVVLGFGFLFSLVTTVMVYLNKYYGKQGEITSEHFKYV